MLGYVTIEKGELKVREYEVYNGFYCGICKSIGRRIGQIPRLALSYDSAFLAIILDSLSSDKNTIERQHCIVHHIEKKPVVLSSAAVDYAADVMVILAYQKFLDDWKDDRNVSAFAGKTAFTASYSKVRKAHPKVCVDIENSLSKLSSLEDASSGSLDATGEAFADVMECLFTGFDVDETSQRVLAAIGRALGYWIYLIDAVDDLEEDLADGSYNPLKYRYPDLTPEEIYEKVSPLLFNYLAQLGNAVDLLDIKKNKGIIDNIIFMGLRRRTETVLGKGTKKNEQSI